MKRENSIKKYFLIVLFVATSIRCINITQPLLEGASTRQTENAMIARNFYQDKLDIFYPCLSDDGDKRLYQLVEFPLIPFFGALLYFLLGGVREFALRGISIFFFICAAVTLYKLASFYFDKELALYSLFAFSFSPLCIYLGRAFQYEIAMIFFIMAAVYFFSKWIRSEKPYELIISAFCFTAAVLLKIPNLYLIIVLLFLAFKRFGFKMFLKLRLYLFFIFVFVIGFLWYKHAYNVMVTYPNKYSIYFTHNLSYIVENIKYYLTHKIFYKVTFDNLVTYTLTPIGFVLAILGFLLDVGESKFRNVFYIWILGVIAFFMLTPAQAMQGYYQIHLLPPISIMIGKCIVVLKNSEFLNKRALFNKKVNFILLLMVIFFVVLRYSYAYFVVPENFRYVVEAGKAIDRLAEKDTLVIASIENGPDLVYYSNRKGWPFTIDMQAKREQDKTEGVDISSKVYDAIENLEQLRVRGAAYFVSASVEKEFLRNKEFSTYMFKNYRVLMKNSKFIIFDLKEKLIGTKRRHI